MTYPTTKQVDSVDTYFGHEVKDPYRWLEDDRSEETGEWVKAQNKSTFGYLNQIPLGGLDLFQILFCLCASCLWVYSQPASVITCNASACLFP